MLSAPKLWKSSSISGPEATSNPARRNKVSMRRRAWVTGCSPPCSSPRPGSVTSMRPAASWPSMAACASATRRASMAACTCTFASLMRAPAAGRSAALRPPRVFSCSVSVPFLPSQRTRASSSAARSPHAAMSLSACPVRAVRSATRPARSADAESGLGLLRDGAKRRRVVAGDVGEHLSVDLPAGLPEAVDDAAVGEAVQTRRGVDARDPQRPELALVLPPVAVGVLPRLDHGLLGGAIGLTPGVVVALRLAQNFLVTAPGRHATLYSCHGGARLLVIREKPHETTDVVFVHETRAAGASLAFDLAGLVAEIVAPVCRIAFEAFRRLAKTLGRGPVGFQLGHRHNSSFNSYRSTGAARHPLGANAQKAFIRPAERYFFFGAKTMIICLPSMSGFCSITACGDRSVDTRSRSLRPMSWCTISRPRNLKVTLALSPSVRKRMRLRSLIW